MLTTPMSRLTFCGFTLTGLYQRTYGVLFNGHNNVEIETDLRFAYGIT
jgi:hypothetical protein